MGNCGLNGTSVAWSDLLIQLHLLVTTQAKFEIYM